MKLPLYSLLAGAASGVAAQGYGTDEVPLGSSKLESEVARLMEKYNSPGMAVAIIDGNKTWSKGFTHHSLLNTTSALITPDTLFATGSTTKSFIAAAWASLASGPNATFSLATPLSQIFPEGPFVFASDVHTTLLTPLDLLSHRTGYAAHVDVASFAPSAAETVERLRSWDTGAIESGGSSFGETGSRSSFTPGGMVPGLRDEWRYNNQMYIALGHGLALLANTDGAGAVLKEAFWDPLRMASTSMGFPGLLDDTDNTTGTTDLPGVAPELFYNNDTTSFVPFPHMDIVPAAGAGGIISTVLDYSRWLRMHLDTSNPLLSAQARQAVWGAHSFVTNSTYGPTTAGTWAGPDWYGLGWEGRVARGEEVWFHSGGVGQYHTQMWAVPSRGVGWVIMQNSAGAAPYVLAEWLLDEVLETPKKLRVDVEALVDANAAAADGILGSCRETLFPSAVEGYGGGEEMDMDELAGTYKHPVFDDIMLSKVCNDTSHVETEGSPAFITRDADGCFLRSNSLTSAGLTLAFELEQAEGNGWIAWVYYDALGERYARPFICRGIAFEKREDGVGFWVNLASDEEARPVRFAKIY